MRPTGRSSPIDLPGRDSSPVGQGSLVVSTTSRVSPASGRHRWYGPVLSCPVPDDHRGGGVLADGPCPLRFFNGHGSRPARAHGGPRTHVRSPASLLPVRGVREAGMYPATGSDIDRVPRRFPGARSPPTCLASGARHNALSLSLPAAAGGQSAKVRCSR